jgi:arylsulfatase A-like enzyme
MADTRMTNYCVQQLKKKQDKPFFLAAGFYAPHKPNYVPEKYLKMHPLDSIRRPPIKEDDLEDVPDIVKTTLVTRSKITTDFLEEHGEIELMIQHYLAACSYADAMIGRLLDALEQSPYRDNTIVVLWSDHGYHHGEKHKIGKKTLWERTSNVPMIWAGPGIARGEKVSTTVSLLDIYPTLASMCGLAAPVLPDGDNLEGVLANPGSAIDKTVLQRDQNRGFSVINKDWRYIRYDNGAEELYDQRNDPNEWTNLASDATFAEIMQNMATHLPTEMAPQAKGPKDRTLMLRLDGMKYEWIEPEPGSKWQRIENSNENMERQKEWEKGRY